MSDEEDEMWGCSGGSRGVSIVSMEPPFCYYNFNINIAYKLRPLTTKLYLFLDMLTFMMAPDLPPRTSS